MAHAAEGSAVHPIGRTSGGAEFHSGREPRHLATGVGHLPAHRFRGRGLRQQGDPGIEMKPHQTIRIRAAGSWACPATGPARLTPRLVPSWGRRHYRGKFKATKRQADAAVAMLKTNGEIVEPVTVPLGTARDKDDLPVLGTAVAGSAAVLVTGDQELLVLGLFRGVAILSPRDFYERLRG